MKYHTLFFQKLSKMLQNLLSAAVVIGEVCQSIRTWISLGITHQPSQVRVFTVHSEGYHELHISYRSDWADDQADPESLLTRCTGHIVG